MKKTKEKRNIEVWRLICTVARRLKVIIPVHLFFPNSIIFVYTFPTENEAENPYTKKEEEDDDDDDDDDEGKLNSSFSRHAASEALD
jgi:hypothetical protein